MSKKRWRRTTPAVQVSDRLALIGESLSISKSEAMGAVRRVADVIGLNQNDLIVLEVLGSLSALQDWQVGSRAIVWPTDQYLKDATGFSLPTLNSCLSNLNKAGLLAFKNSLNGKRWGQRDESGAIIEAFGFDLSPMAAQTAELEWLHEAREFERACQDDRDGDGEATLGRLLSFITTVTYKIPTSALSRLRVQLRSFASALVSQKIITGSLSTMFHSFFGFWAPAPSDGQQEQRVPNEIANFDTHADQDFFDAKPQPIVKMRFAANRQSDSVKTPVRLQNTYSAAQQAVLVRTERKTSLKYQPNAFHLAGVTKATRGNIISASSFIRPIRPQVSSSLVPANAPPEAYWCKGRSLLAPFLLPLSNEIQMRSTSESHERPIDSLVYCAPGAYRKR